MTTSLSLVCYNIQYSLGVDGRYDLARSLDVVRDADVICLQEIDRGWRRTNLADQAAEIERLMPDRYVGYIPAIDVDASEVGPDGVVVNRRRQFGQMIVSRFPILSLRIVPLPKIHHDAPNLWCCAGDAVLDLGDASLRVINIHLADAFQPERVVQSEAMIRYLAALPDEGPAFSGSTDDPEEHDHWQLADRIEHPTATVVAGDFNDSPDSEVMNLWYAAGYRDAWNAETAKHPGWVTFKTNPPQGVFEDMRIDFVLVSDEVTVEAAEIDVDCEASDHQPVWTWLSI